jgi:lipoprotein-releasing system permease protein
MFKPLSLFIGLRYTRAKRKNHFISFISLTSILGIALGVTALITVLSVMNGFEKELRHRMLGMAPHIEVQSTANSFGAWQALATSVAQQPQVISVTPSVQGQGMVTRQKSVQGVVLQGIVPDNTDLIAALTENKSKGFNNRLPPLDFTALKAGDFKVFIGEELQRSLGVAVGDKITLVVPQASVTIVGMLPRMKRMQVAGVFRVGMHEADSGLVLMNIADAATLLRLPKGHIHSLHLKLKEIFSAPPISQQLNQTLLHPKGYYSLDWTYRHANFFKAVKMEKRVMSIILILIVAVAAFNIVSTLVMVVTDKQADIAILRTLGSSPREIMQIFMVQGCLIGVFGTLLGLAGGLGLALNIETLVPAIEHFFHTDLLPDDVYYISDLPSDLQWPDVIKIVTTSLILSLLATLYPARKAARTQPAEALRYE